MAWKSALGGVSIAAFVLAGAARAEAPMQAAFGNTILSTYPDGRTAELWLHPDGSYDAEGRKGDPSSGHWSTKGDKLCLKQSKPMSSLFSFCKSMPAEGLAAGYTTKAVTGETIQVKLVRGRAKGHQGPPPS
ncbi:MAG TPA: hypothetical protein VHY34_04805 [Caulobacteraceae bacterium]|jgi:hypothetical protein|nr:hypothetical protein [Caulobacteraceae bacterium]